jgi:hypothetical protein
MSMNARARWKSSLYAGMGVLLTLVAACKKTDEPVDESPNALAEDGSDSAAAETDAELVTSSLVAGTAVEGRLGLASTDLAPSDVGTRDIGDGAKALFFPRGCLSASNDPATSTVTYVFAGCAGPNGLLRIVGQIKARYRTEPNKLFLDLTGEALRVNGASIDWHATAEITADGGAREMKWHGQLTGSTPRGRTFSRTNDKVVAWRFGDRCYAVSGVSNGDVRGKQIKTEVIGFRRCGRACPEAGGKVVITDVTKDKRIEIAFNGSKSATYTGPKGDTTPITLACGVD